MGNHGMTSAPSTSHPCLASGWGTVPDWGTQPAEDIFGRVVSAGWRARVVESITRLTGSARSGPYVVEPKVFVAQAFREICPSPSQCHNGGENMATIRPDSGIQLLIIIGAMFIFASVRPDLGMMLLVLGVGAWALYNVANLTRQF